MITVVIASYRYAHLLSHAIESVLGQTKQPKEIIVVDDAGGDGCEEIANTYGVQCITRRRNLGTAANFQDVLMNHVFTKYTLFLGADNWLRSDTLETLSDHNEDIISYDIVYTGQLAKKFSERFSRKERLHGDYVWRFQKGNIFHGNYIHGSSLYNADLAKAVGGYSRGEGKNSEEDWELWKKMISHGATHKHIPETMLYYRRHTRNFNDI